MATLIQSLTELLASGYSQEQAATALGVSPGRISQILTENPDIRGQVQAMRASRLTGEAAHEDRKRAVAASLLGKLEELVEADMFHRPTDVLMAYKVLEASRKPALAAPALGDGASGGSIVTIVLPQAARDLFTVTSVGSVVEAGGQNLLTLPSQNLAKLAETHRHELI